MNKAYKFRIYPNIEQKVLIEKTFGSVRFVYNKMLEYRKNLYETEGKSLSKFDCNNYCNRELKSTYEWLKEVDAFALTNAVFNLDTAYKKFFKEHRGYPKFKSKTNNKKSYSTNSTHNSIRFEDGKLKLPKLGLIKIKQHREIPEGYIIKSATIIKTPTEKYFVSLLCEYESFIQPIEPKSYLGLDFSMSDLYIDSNGNSANYPKFYRQLLERLAREERKLSHCQKGSNNYKKQRVKVAKIYEKIANQRKDFLHKQSKQIANDYDCVAIEDLNMQAMSKSLNFGKSVMDDGWGMFTTFLQYKLAEKGKRLAKVNKFFASSQLCNKCGYQNENTKNISIRDWICPKCGANHDRDVNAAINIRNEGMRLLTA